MNKQSQCQKVLSFMRTHGSINCAQAWDMGIAALHSRISDLRRQGLCIETKRKTLTMPDGTKHTFAYYEEVK